MHDGLQIRRDSTLYPAALRERLGAHAPEVLTARGDVGVLSRPLVALLASVRIPPELVLPALDRARALRDAGEVVISGFQSPLERECLDFLLRGPQPVVVCPARGIGSMRLPAAWEHSLAGGRLLLLSRHGPRVRRPTARMAEARNRMVAALAERVFLAHATPGGRLHRLAAEIAERGQPMECLPHPGNEDLLLLGARGAAPV